VRRLLLILAGGGAAIAAASAASAAGKSDVLAACMWEKMPTTTAAFVAERDDMKAFSLFMKAAADCDPPAGNLNLSSLRKKLAASRPATIGPDGEAAAQASVCTSGADAAPECRPAGE
jgi:hypothetical protein